MPQLDAYIPAGALSPDAERDLIAKVTDLLIRHEGADPTNETVRSIAWVFVHRPETVYVGGAPAAAPRYRFVASVPEGQFNEERRQAMTERDHRGRARRRGRRPPARPDARVGLHARGARGHVGRRRPRRGPGRHRRPGARRRRGGREYAERVFAERRGEPVAAG